jgi:Tfp pilus assembly protein PilV
MIDNSKLKIQNLKLLAGQSIFEIVLAVGVVTVVLVALVALVSTAQKNTTAAKNRSEGTRMIQEAIEWLRYQRDLDWGTFYARTSGNPTWCLNSLDWNTQSSCTGSQSGKPFSREVAFTRTPSDPNTVKAAIKVRWVDGQGSHEIKSETYFTNWRQ